MGVQECVEQAFFHNLTVERGLVQNVEAMKTLLEDFSFKDLFRYMKDSLSVI